MHRSQTKVNPNLIMVPLIPITYTSSQLHEKLNTFSLQTVAQTVVSNIIFLVLFVSFSQSGTYLVLLSLFSYFSLSLSSLLFLFVTSSRYIFVFALTPLTVIKTMTSQNTKRKLNYFVIGSRLRERDKKNEEYYVGDYSDLLLNYLHNFNIQLYYLSVIYLLVISYLYKILIIY